MNIIKAQHRSGGPIFRIKVQQKRDLRTSPFHGDFWGSPAQTKDRLIRQGLQLIGRRQ